MHVWARKAQEGFLRHVRPLNKQIDNEMWGTDRVRQQVESREVAKQGTNDLITVIWSWRNVAEVYRMSEPDYSAND